MSDERAAVSAIVLTAMGNAWSDSEEYSALPGVTAGLLLTSDWLAEHDRQVAERAWDEGFTRGFYAGQSYPDGADASEPDIDNPYHKERENRSESWLSNSTTR